MQRVFISYRRADAQSAAKAIRKELVKRFGPDAVYFDLYKIGWGQKFRLEIERALAESNVVVVVIGPTWLTVQDESGRRRIDNPDDVVRYEVAEALKSSVEVRPILVNGAPMPTAGQLPKELADLPELAASTYRDERENEDLRIIGDQLGPVLRAEWSKPICPNGHGSVPAAANFCPTCSAPVVRRPAGPVGERQHVTLLAAALAADVPSRVLHTWSREALETVDGCGGAGREMDDGLIVASFGLNDPSEDDPKRAAGAARLIADLADRRSRVGLATEWVELAGGPWHASPEMESVIRLSQRAAEGVVLLGPATMDIISDHFVVTSMPSPVADEEVGGLVLVLGEPRRRRPDVPLVGREPELAQLAALLAGLVQRAEGHIVGVSGEAGMGVTRLLREARALAGSEVTWLEGRCSGPGATASYQPFIDVLRAQLPLAGDESPAAVYGVLKEFMEELLGDANDEHLPALAFLLNALPEPTKRGFAEGEPEQIEAQIVKAYRSLLKALCAVRGPVVLFVDELQWADEKTVDLAKALLSLTRSEPILLAAGFRPGLGGHALELRIEVMRIYGDPDRSTEIALRSLSDEAMRALSRSLAPGTAEPVVKAVIERAEGNPFFLEVLLRTLRDRGALNTECGDDPLAGLPPKLASLLYRRVSELPQRYREVAQCASVIGRKFLRQVLEEVTGDVEGELDELDARRVAEAIKSATPPEWQFTHVLLHESVAATVGKAKRIELSGKVGEVSERLGLGSEADLARYYVQSADEAKALKFCELAGDRYFALHANQEAVEWWSRALDRAVKAGDEAIGDRIKKKLADALVPMGQIDRAARYYLELAAVISDPDEAAVLLAEAAFTVLQLDRYDEGEALILQASTLKPASAPAQAAVILAEARADWGREDVAAMGKALSGLEELPLDGLPVHLAYRRMLLWDVYLDHIGDLDGSTAWEDQMLRLAEEHDDQVLLLTATYNVGISRVGRGDLAGAYELLRQCCDDAEERGFLTQMAKAGVNALYCLWMSGKLAEGLSLARRLEPAVASPRWQAMFHSHWGLLEFDSGTLDEARSHFETAQRLAVDLNHATRMAEAAIALGAVHVRAGRYREGSRAIRAALGKASPTDQVLGHAWLAEASLGQGHATKAERLALDGLVLRATDAEKIPLRRLLGVAREARRPGSGRADLEEALAAARSTGRRLEEARTLLALVECGQAPESDGRMTLTILTELTGSADAGRRALAPT